MVDTISRLRPIAWILLLSFSIPMVLYFVSYVGDDWYVVPVEPFPYPPNNQSTPLRFGLFRMCIQNYCNYDLRIDYMIVKYLPFKDIQDSYQRFRSVWIGLISVGMAFLVLSLGCYFYFLSSLFLSHLFGFVCGLMQILGCIFTIVGMIIFGTKFRGSTKNPPYGWCVGLMAFSLIWIITIAILIIILNIFIVTSKNKFKYKPPTKEVY